MKKPYLIQRATIRPEVKDTDIKGIDSLLSFDYMGSAEFEFGALPAGLRVSCALFDQLKVHRVDDIRQHGAGARLRLICKLEDVEYLTDFWTQQIIKPYGSGLKELTYMECAVTTTSSLKDKANCWWDLDNGWWAVFGAENAQKIIKALQKVKEKKGW
jgi:hypothetical protein